MSDPIITMALVNMVKRHEGKRLKAYKCPAGYWTIGYGHNLDARPLTGETYWTIGYGHNLDARPLTGETLKRMGYMADVEPEDLIITQGEAERILQQDLEDAWADLESVFPELRTWDWVRREALLDMMFWHGKVSFLGFTKMLAAVRFYNWNLAAVEMMDSDSGRRYPGRMAELAEMVRTDKYQGVA